MANAINKSFGQLIVRMTPAPEGAGHDMEVICSTATSDRSEETIDQAGWMLDSFHNNPVFLACHKYSTDSGASPVIGSFKSMEVTDGKLCGKVKFASTPLGQEYKTLFAEGHMRAVSVGFISHKPETVTDKATGKKTLCHKKNELLEVSAVPVPANPEALTKELQQQKQLTETIKSIVDEKVDELRTLIVQQFDELKALQPDLGDHARYAGAGDGDDADSHAAKGQARLNDAADSLVRACS